MMEKDEDWGTFRIDNIPMYKRFFEKQLDLDYDKILINEDGNVYYEGKIVAQIIDNSQKGDYNE